MNTKVIFAICFWAVAVCNLSAQTDTTPAPADKKIEIKKGDTNIGIDFSDDDDDNDDDDKNKAPKPPRRTKTYFMIATGVTSWTDQLKEASISNDLGKSWFSELGLMGKTRLGGEKSPVSIKYGVTYLWHNIDIKNRTLEYNDETKVVSFTNDSVTIDSKIDANFVTIPLSLEFKLGKKANLGVGGYFGFKAYSATRVKSDGKDNREVETRTKYGYGINPLMYGLKATLGYRGLDIYARYDMSNFFKDDSPKINPASIGIAWSF